MDENTGPSGLSDLPALFIFRDEYTTMTHLLLVTANRFGVLARITSVVSSAGANIETAAAYPIAASSMSIVHLCIDADGVLAERLRRKLSRLVEVLEVTRRQ
jgi:acetolactate synthase small subunit